MPTDLFGRMDLQDTVIATKLQNYNSSYNNN